MPFYYAEVIHGTYYKAWEGIRNSGMKRFARNHMHFAKGYPKGLVISGMRSNIEVVIEINVERAMLDGIRFFRSQNDVILTSGEDGFLHRVKQKEYALNNQLLCFMCP